MNLNGQTHVVIGDGPKYEITGCAECDRLRAELAAAKAEVARRGNLVTAFASCLEDTLDRARFMGDEETERLIREASEIYTIDAAWRGEGV